MGISFKDKDVKEAFDEMKTIKVKEKKKKVKNINMKPSMYIIKPNSFYKILWDIFANLIYVFGFFLHPFILCTSG